jgi:hypothetical protein
VSTSQAWDDANPNAPLIGRAFAGARIACGADYAETPSEYPRQVRVLAAAALFRGQLMTAKAAARECAVGQGSGLAPTQLEKAHVSDALIRTVVAFLVDGKVPAEPPIQAPVAATPQPQVARAAKPHRLQVSRFASADIDPARVQDLRADHPALIKGHSIFTDQVVGTHGSPRFLVSGHNNPKLGKKVLKGPRTGWPIFQLTLEERTTCPRSCPVWAGCYGNAMPYARRHRVDAEFMGALRSEVLTVARQYPAGLLIRLHTLGDFFSVEYVLLWAELLAELPQLHVFGYTARREDDADPETQKIAKAVRMLTTGMWSRFAIRTSHPEFGSQRSVVVDVAPDVPNVIVCPAQVEATEACATCGLCWAEPARGKTIAFLKHGMKRAGPRFATGGILAPDPLATMGEQASPTAAPMPAPARVRAEPMPTEAPVADVPRRLPELIPVPTSEIRGVVGSIAPKAAVIQPPRPIVRAKGRAMPRGTRLEDLGGGVQVIRMKSITPKVLRWARSYREQGVDLDTLADLFDIDADTLGKALEA